MMSRLEWSRFCAGAVGVLAVLVAGCAQAPEDESLLSDADADAGAPGAFDCPPPQTNCVTACADLEFSAEHCGACATPCAPDSQCVQGSCTAIADCTNECEGGASECSTEGTKTCGQHDADPCTEWSEPTPCVEGQRCDEAVGACVDGCDSECTSGARECVGGGWRACGQLDDDACLDWSAPTLCTGGTVCEPATAACQPACGDNCKPFSIVLLPDIQFYTEPAKDSLDSLTKQIRWILSHRVRDDIRAAIQLGDITDNNKEEEWANASTAFKPLDAAGLPYSITTGNHDYRPITTPPMLRARTQFDDAGGFPASRFSGKSWYGGHLGDSNANNYTFFEAGGRRFMVLSLEYAPRKETLCAAEKLVEAHPDRRVIVATHCYMGVDGGYVNCPSDDYLTEGVNARGLWDEFISHYSTIFLVVSGHINESAHRANKGQAGNVVHQLVVDYQQEAACPLASAAKCTDFCQEKHHINGRDYHFAGNGWLRQLVFDPLSNRIHAKTFSAEAGNKAIFPGGTPRFFCSELNHKKHNVYKASPTAADHQFDLAYDLATAPAFAKNTGGKQGFLDRTVNQVSAGQQLTPRVAMSATGDFAVTWEDDASSADGTGKHDIKMRGFKAGGCGAFDELVVNSATKGHQKTPDLAIDAARNVTVVWADDADGDGRFVIRARGYRADGTPRFSLASVSTSVASQHLNPVIAMAPDGRFVVAWEAGDSGAYQVRLRGFEADGAERFAERTVNQAVAGTHLAPAVALDASARVFVAWQDDSDGNDAYQIRLRGLGTDGAPRADFPERTANATAEGQQTHPVIAVDSAGASVVGWEDDPDSNGQSLRIRARGFTPTGGERIGDFAVPGDSVGNRRAPSVSMQPSGAFVFTWQDDTDGNGAFQIHGRAFTASGAEWRARWTVNRLDAGAQLAPGVALVGGKAVFVWQDDLDGNGTYQVIARGVDLP